MGIRGHGLLVVKGKNNKQKKGKIAVRGGGGDEAYAKKLSGKSPHSTAGEKYSRKERVR